MESDVQESCGFSTPVCAGGILTCTLSSISDHDSRPSSNTKKSRFLPVAIRKYTIDNEDKNESTNADSTGLEHENQDCENGENTIGEVIREGMHIPPDIQPCSLNQLFYRSEYDILILRKSLDESLTEPKSPIPKEPNYLSNSESSFTGIVNQHDFTYTRIPRKTEILPLKTQVYFNTITADLLWDDFIQNNSHLISFQKKKKNTNCFRTMTHKFFKSRGELQQKGGICSEGLLPKKKKNGKVRFEDVNIAMPSLKRPLGWMAIKGLGIAERQEVCDGPMNSSYNSIQSYRPPLKKVRKPQAEEISSPNHSKDEEVYPNSSNPVLSREREKKTENENTNKSSKSDS